MKYTPYLYARTLLEILADVPQAERQQILKRFIGTVYRNGDGSRINAILAEVGRQERAARGGRIVEVLFARNQARGVLDAFRGLFRKNDEVHVRIDPSLVAGVRVTIDGEYELDYSFGRRLRKLFR